MAGILGAEVTAEAFEAMQPVGSDCTRWSYAERFIPFQSEREREIALDMINEGRAQLWAGSGWAAVTAVTPQNNLRLISAGGDFMGVCNGLLDMLAYAAGIGANGVEINEVLQPVSRDGRGSFVHHQHQVTQ